MRRFAVALTFTPILAVCFPSIANAGDLFQALLQCKRQAEIQSVDEASVLLRSYPLGLSRVKIHPQRQNLVGTLASRASDALVGQTIVKLSRRSAGDDTAQDFDEQSRNIFIFGKESTPDAIAVFRGREITVFPRLLLAYPRTSLVRIMPGDLIATFESQRRLTPDNKQELFHEVLISKANEGKRAGRTAIRGSLADRDRAKQLMDLFNKSDDILVLEMMEVFESNQSEAMHESLASSVPVYVIQRFYHGVLIRYVIPWRMHGLFGEDGRLFNGLVRMASDTGANLQRWDEVMVGWELLTVKPGDKVTVGFIETDPFFQQVAL
ncbi:MAG: hypothetical protein KDB00_26075 [Planctomycetales bacterium]|nr:hypothetical protein [Planctomycetales bacterium]